MRHSAIVLAAALAAACIDPKYPCTTDTNCPTGTSCDVGKKLCVIVGGCTSICKPNETCQNAQCVALTCPTCNPDETCNTQTFACVKAPVVSGVTAPSTWSARTLGSPPNLIVTAVVDDSNGPGLASAALHVKGQLDVNGTTTATAKTYSFSVPPTYQTPGSETPLPFTITGTDTAGFTTSALGAGKGVLLIDDLAPSVNSISSSGGFVDGNGVHWFPQSQSADVVIQANILEAGSGLNTSSLHLLVPTSSPANAQLDHGTASCVQSGTQGIQTCTFKVQPSTVPTSILASPGQLAISFVIAGSDNVMNLVQSGGSNTGKLGIDGKPPTITFTLGNFGDTSTTSNYPANFADCNGTTVDPAMFCGHDGSHFLRAGDAKYKLAFTVSDVYSPPDNVGSGVDPAGETCSIAGSAATCTVTYNAGTGTFSFPADFSGATFSSGADGTGMASVTVNAKDMVGNAATAVTISTVQVSRLKWVRSMATKVDTFKGSPVVTSLPVPQIIFAGAQRDTSGPIVSFAPDGTVLWRAGVTSGVADVTTISNNVAYSSTTHRLYVLGDNASQLFVYDPTNIVSGEAQRLYACAIDDGILSSGQAVGAPAILGGTTERAFVGDTGEHRLWAFSKGSTAGTCALPATTNSAGGWTGTINPPTTDGTNVFLGHDTSKLARVPFSGGAFGTVTEAASFSLRIFGPVAIAGALVFGDIGNLKVNSYDSAALTSNWTSSAALGDNFNASPVVSPSFVLASPQTGDGQLHAFNKSTGSATTGFTWPTTATKIGNISAPTLGADGTVYFADDGNKELVPLKVTGNTPAMQMGWAAAFKGGATQAIGTGNTLVDGLGTEPTIDGSGVLYFATGTALGKVYAIITDSGGPLVPTAGSTWPRVGFDNCNSSNTAFTCQ